MTGLIFATLLVLGGLAIGQTAPLKPRYELANKVAVFGFGLLAASLIYLSAIGSL